MHRIFSGVLAFGLVLSSGGARLNAMETVRASVSLSVSKAPSPAKTSLVEAKIVDLDSENVIASPKMLVKHGEVGICDFGAKISRKVDAGSSENACEATEGMKLRVVIDDAGKLVEYSLIRISCGESVVLQKASLGIR